MCLITQVIILKCFNIYDIHISIYLIIKKFNSESHFKINKNYNNFDSSVIRKYD